MAVDAVARPEVAAWVQVFGLVSFELYGHFANGVHEVDAVFAHAVELTASDLFVPEPD